MTENPPPPEKDPEGDTVLPTRRPLGGYPVTVVLLAAIVTLSVLLVVKDRADAGDAAKPSTSPAPSLRSPTPLAAAPDHGTVRVVESGFENIRDVAGERQVTWGAIVANTSDAATATALLTLTYRDAGGKKIKTESFYRSAVVPTILPGQRTGIGDSAYVDSRVSTVTVRVDRVAWSPDSGTAKPQMLTVSHVTTDWRDQGESVPYWGDDTIGEYTNDRGDLYVMFRVDSTYRTVVTDPGAAAVFRDAHGDIIGGSPLDDIDGGDAYPTGWSDHHIKVKYGPPDDIAEARTQVYAYPSSDQSGYGYGY